MNAKLFYDVSKPSAFSTLAKLQAAINEQAEGKRGSVPLANTRAWLVRQDAYTLHRPLRKYFPRNPYVVSNVMELWESDLLDVQNISKFNDNYKYILTVIDVFSKFLHDVPLRSKTVPTSREPFNPSSMIRNIPDRINYVRSLCGQIRAKSFLTRPSKTC